MREQKIGNAFVGIDLILDPREAVSFILVNLHIDRAAAFLDGVHHLLRLRFRTARIMSAGQQQQRRLYLIDVIDRRPFLI